MKWPSDKKLQLINRVLVAFIILCNLYVLLTPLIPKVSFKVGNIVSKPVKISYEDPASLDNISRNQNQLVIPSMKLTKPIFEGTNPNTVHRGIWLRPNGSTPDNNSNTVLVGHRFSYKNPSVLYHLDEVKKGEEIFVVWDKKIYAYRVNDIKIVNPNQTEIEAPSGDAMLTIYTCTPLWSTAKRLVVTANLEKVL